VKTPFGAFLVAPNERKHMRPFYGWLIALVAACAAFSSGPGQSYVFSIVIDPMLRDTGLSRTALSALYAVGTVMSAIMVIGVSRLVDRFGARIMLSVIGLTLGVACFGLALSAGPATLFLSFAALRAFGQGSLPITATLLTAQWFVRYRGRAMALVSLGLALSNALFPSLVRWLVTLVDWRGAYMVLGVLVWLLVIPATLLLVRNRPEDLGLYPDAAAAPPEQERQAEPQAGAPLRRPVMRTRQFWVLALPLSATSFIATGLVFHQVSMFAERGLLADVAAGVFVPFAMASAGAMTLVGFVIERLGPKRLLFVIQALLFSAVWQLQWITTPGAAILYAVTLGSAAGVQSVTAGVTWAHYYGRRGLGRVQGAASMVMISAAALAPLPLAALHQWSGNYTLGLIVLLGIPIVCSVLAVFVSNRQEDER